MVIDKDHIISGVKDLLLDLCEVLTTMRLSSN